MGSGWQFVFQKYQTHCTQVVVVSRRLWWCPFFCSWKIWRDWYQNCILSEWFKPDEAHNKTRAISFVELFICWTGLILIKKGAGTTFDNFFLTSRAVILFSERWNFEMFCIFCRLVSLERPTVEVEPKSQEKQIES